MQTTCTSRKKFTNETPNRNRFYNWTAAKMNNNPWYDEYPTNGQSNGNTRRMIVEKWAEFIKNQACEGKFRETQLPLRKKHYEQFGRLLLEVYEIINTGHSSARELNDRVMSFFPDSADWIAEGPGCSEDRLFYRVYLMMIGHPDFQCDLSIDDLENDRYSYWLFILSIASRELDRFARRRR